MKKRRQSKRVASSSITSFCVILINDAKIIDEPCVLMVNNIADKDRVVTPDPLYDGTTPHMARRQGKGKGLGNPGGGQKRSDMETPSATAANEVERETGFTVKNLRGLFAQPKIGITYRGEKVVEIPFEIGQDPPFYVPPGHEATENVVCIFNGEIAWEGSLFQKILHRIKREEDLTPEIIREEGLYVWFDDIDEEELEALNIIEDDEINMMGVFPLSLILTAMRKLRDIDAPDWVKAFYESHIIRISGACRMMGIRSDDFDEALSLFEQKGGNFKHTPFDSAIRYLSRISNASAL
jgi:hypothetical protein